VKSYLLASTAAALASVAMALWSQPDGTSAVASARVPSSHGLARAEARSPRHHAMARRGARPWLLRAMSESGDDGTLTSAPDEPPTQPPSL